MKKIWIIVCVLFGLCACSLFENGQTVSEKAFKKLNELESYTMDVTGTVKSSVSGMDLTIPVDMIVKVANGNTHVDMILTVMEQEFPLEYWIVGGDVYMQEDFTIEKMTSDEGTPVGMVDLQNFDNKEIFTEFTLTKESDDKIVDIKINSEKVLEQVRKLMEVSEESGMDPIGLFNGSDGLTSVEISKYRITTDKEGMLKTQELAISLTGNTEIEKPVFVGASFDLTASFRGFNDTKVDPTEMLAQYEEQEYLRGEAEKAFKEMQEKRSFRFVTANPGKTIDIENFDLKDMYYAVGFEYMGQYISYEDAGETENFVGIYFNKEKQKAFYGEAGNHICLDYRIGNGKVILSYGYSDVIEFIPVEEGLKMKLSNPENAYMIAQPLEIGF